MAHVDQAISRACSSVADQKEEIHVAVHTAARIRAEDQRRAP
jgi:hypothetical protein